MEPDLTMSGQSALSQVVSAVWYILPAYLANGSALVIGGGPPLDCGRILPDGRRILGDGVTWRGTVGAILVGIAVGGIQGALASRVGYGLAIGAAMGSGAMLGDSLGSFTKRRLGIERGHPAPVLDQLGFLVFALALAHIVSPVSWETVLILVILTPLIHIASNAGAYLSGIKRVWY